MENSTDTSVSWSVERVTVAEPDKNDDDAAEGMSAEVFVDE
jgi:hypothetical protein